MNAPLPEPEPTMAKGFIDVRACMEAIHDGHMTVDEFNAEYERIHGAAPATPSEGEA